MKVVPKREPGKTGVQIQVKDKGGSKSFTVHGISRHEAINRIRFIFERMAESKKDITIIHYKSKEDEHNGRNETARRK